MTVTQRFTRAVALAEIDRALEHLYTAHRFTRATGCSQVEHDTDTARVLAYGEVMAVEHLRERLAEGVRS